MALNKVSEGISSLIEPVDYHTRALAGRKLYAFGLQYHDQKTFSWGHRVIYQGGYVAVFDLSTKELSKIEYPAVSIEENLDELLFVHENQIYLLLHTSFGSVEIKGIYLWKNNVFNQVQFEAPPSKSVDPTARVWFKKADGVSSGGELIFFGNSEGAINVYALNISESSASGKFVTIVSGESNPLRGTATSGFVSGDKVAIGFGVDGCGYRWENARFLTVNLANKELGHISVEGDAPSFAFSGAKYTTILHNGDWAHVTGSVPQGMCNSKFEGSVWALHDVFGTPKWKKLDLELPEDAFIQDGQIYLIDKDQVAVGFL